MYVIQNTLYFSCIFISVKDLNVSFTIEQPSYTELETERRPTALYSLICNMSSGQGATVKRFVVLIRTLGTYNSILLVSWLPVLVGNHLHHTVLTPDFTLVFCSCFFSGVECGVMKLPFHDWIPMSVRF